MTGDGASTAMREAPEVVLERHADVLIIRLNRPHARNAINAAVTARLGAALEELQDDDALRVAVLTGTGSVFCAGQDLKAFAAGEPVVPADRPEWGFAGWVSHFSAKPIIAALNGHAFGGGLELALACDLIVAADDAMLGLPEVTRGLFAAGGGVPRIVQQLPEKIGLHMLLTGDPMSVAEAARWGLVNETVAANQVLPRALALAGAIARNAPLSVQATKKVAALAGHTGTWTPEAWELVRAEFDRVFSSEDAAEGAAAFAHKRAPVWSGR